LTVAAPLEIVMGLISKLTTLLVALVAAMPSVLLTAGA
jgi:hypothetical protein